MIPPLDGRGLLPPGVHKASLEEVVNMFVVNDRRLLLWSRFELFLNDVVNGTNDEWSYMRQGKGLVIAGSFLSDKEEPKDIECTMFFNDLSNSAKWELALRSGKDNEDIKDKYLVDFLPSVEGCSNLREFFQYVGPKTANDKGLGVKDYRGVVELIKW